MSSLFSVLKPFWDIIVHHLAEIFALKTLKVVFSSLILALEWTIGGFDSVVRALLLLMTLDFILGFGIAYIRGELSRKKLLEGLVKILLYMIGISMGDKTDTILFHSAVEYGFRNLVIVYLWVTESLSIIKHMGTLGVKIPKGIVNKLEKYRDGLDK